MQIRTKLTILIAALLPGVVLATPYDGIYRQVANADCALVGVDGGSIEIRDGLFHGVETQCRMVNPVNVVNMDATLYDMECAGEGTQWAERAMVMHSADRQGIIMVWNGYAFRYDRCEIPD